MFLTCSHIVAYSNSYPWEWYCKRSLRFCVLPSLPVKTCCYTGSIFSGLEYCNANSRLLRSEAMLCPTPLKILPEWGRGKFGKFNVRDGFLLEHCSRLLWVYVYDNDSLMLTCWLSNLVCKFRCCVWVNAAIRPKCWIFMLS